MSTLPVESLHSQQKKRAINFPRAQHPAPTPSKGELLPEGEVQSLSQDELQAQNEFSGTGNGGRNAEKGPLMARCAQPSLLHWS
jgi:hypothetical protein